MIQRARDPSMWEWINRGKAQKPSTVATELKIQHADDAEAATKKKSPAVLVAKADDPKLEAPAALSIPADKPADDKPPAGGAPSAEAPPPSPPPPPASSPATSEPSSDSDKLPPEALPTGPQVTGLTDETPSEADGFFKKNALAITDGTTKVQR